MAAGGFFAKELTPEGWFDETLRPEGWFSQDFLEPSSGGVDATANGAILTYSFAFLAGSASGGGAIDATANGVTVAYSYSLISGAASASSTANGVTFTFSESLISGAAQASSSVSGQTFSFSYVFVPGAASGQSGATASGQTFTYSYSLIGGIASGGQGAQIDGGDISSRKRPIIHYTGKVARKLDKALEIVENIQPEARTSVKRAAVKQARELLFDVRDYSPAIQAINSALAKVSRLAGGVESFRQSVLSVEQDIERELAEVNRRRRRLEEEVLVTWLFN